MAGLNDEGNGGSSSPQPASPPRLVNISVGDESLTTTLTKPDATLPKTPESFSSQSSNNNDVNNLSSGSSYAKSDSINNINNYPNIDPNDPSKMALDNYSQHSNPYADSVTSSNPYADSAASTTGASSGKAMEVTVTVLSLHGISAKRNDSSNKKKKKEEKTRTKRRRRGGARSAEIDKPTATVVASFSQNVSKDRVFLTHVPSLPVSLTPDAPASGSDAKRGNASRSGGEMLRPVVQWSSMDADDEEAGKALSTLRFKRRFVRENNPNAIPGAADRYLPQTCPINLSISRNGRMALLGKVSLIINGEERGKGSVTVPITSSIPPSKSTLPTPNPVKMGKKIRNMGKSKDASGEKDKATPMVRIKGDNYKFGLDEGAMLRMLVHVHDPDVIPEEESFCVEEAYGDAEHGNDAYGDEAYGNGGAAYGGYGVGAYGEGDYISDNERLGDDSISDNKDDECRLSVEGDDPSILGGDDYFNHLHSNNELHALRQQLAKSEQTNNVLQMELANAQYSLNQMSQLTMQHKVEYDALVLKLHFAMQNSNALLQELETAKSECELLPIYENRVTELLEELRKRDGEVEELTERAERGDLEVGCLKEEIDTLNGRYKRELVDSLLWDDDKDGDANPGGKSDDDGSVDVQADEKKIRDGTLDKWGMRKLGIGLNAVPEKKGSDIDEDDEEKETDKEEACEKEAEAKGVDPKKAEAPQDHEVLEILPSETIPDASLETSAGEGVVDTIGSDRGGEEGGSPDDAWPWAVAEDDKTVPLGGESPEDSEGERAQDDLPAALEAAATVDKDKEENDQSPKKEASGRRGWGVRLLVGRSSTMADEESTNDNAWVINDAAKKEDEEEECSTSVSSISSSSSSGDDGAGAASTRQGRGWGIRGLGASLLSMEERMRERQQLFQEQQLNKAAEKRARDKAAAAVAGSEGVLISRFSGHGAKRGTAGEEALVEESGEESCEGTDDELAKIEKPSHWDDASSSDEAKEKESSEEVMSLDQPRDKLGSKEEAKVEVAAKEEGCESERGHDDKEARCSDSMEKLLSDTVRAGDESTTGPNVNADAIPGVDAAGDGALELTEVPDIPPPKDAEEANRGAKVGTSAPPEGSDGEAPITPLIVGVAPFSWDGDGTAPAAGGDIKNTSGGVSAEVEGEGAPSLTQGKKKSDDPTDQGTSDAIVSSAGRGAEAKGLSTTYHAGMEADKVPDMPSANDGSTSQSKKDLKGWEEEPRTASSEAKGANTDASLEKQKEPAAKVAIVGDAPSEEAGGDRWGVRRLGASLAFRKETRGEDSVREEKEKDPATPAESPPSEETQDDSPKKQHRGWAIRGLGARLKNVEGKMKERQRLFREQQQRELERAEKEKALTAVTAAAQSELGSALSSHDGKIPATLAPDGGGDEEPTDASGKGVDKTQAEGPAASPSGEGGEEDEPNDELTEEAREHRRRSNQALLLESMDRLEEELLSGIISYDDETAKDKVESSVLIDSIDKSLTATSWDTNSNDEDASSAIPSEPTHLLTEGTFDDYGHAFPGESADETKEQALGKATNDAERATMTEASISSDVGNDRRAKLDTPSLEAEEVQDENCREITEKKEAAGAGSSSHAEGAKDGPNGIDNISNQEMKDRNDSYIGLIEELPIYNDQ